MKNKKQKKQNFKKKQWPDMLKKVARPVKKDVKIKTPEDRLLWKLVGVALMAFAVFLVVALASYDWRAAAAKGAIGVNGNLVGIFGNTIAHWMYVCSIRVCRMVHTVCVSYRFTQCFCTIPK